MKGIGAQDQALTNIYNRIKSMTEMKLLYPKTLIMLLKTCKLVPLSYGILGKKSQNHKADTIVRGGLMAERVLRRINSLIC